MPHRELQQIIDWTIANMNNEQLSDESLQALRVLLPDSVIIAAFDLIDRGRVIKYNTPWGRTFFEVFGTNDRYSVSVDLPSPTTSSCVCPAFIYNVLLSDAQPTCKHILAVQLARSLGKLVERTITQDELVAILCPGMIRPRNDDLNSENRNM